MKSKKHKSNPPKLNKIRQYEEMVGYVAGDSIRRKLGIVTLEKASTYKLKQYLSQLQLTYNQIKEQLNHNR